eukprot:CAMPEP_0196575246 /NCGR_PEP_ID=MMETSP1081-20130531/4762_1 /TAXON_ID=36882 /ORGANISM="Pyramimonas amylifera, Strain CCMP720" /LENGTH=48 /DNA_ID= /DNA_START= /DNA_END= /DNA_ORIENTATION=
MASRNLHLADVAGGDEGGLGGVVQVVENHHGRVLGAPERIELEVVALA